MTVTIYGIVQIGKSSASISLLSGKESDTFPFSTNTRAVYKGLTVAVCTVDKTEVNLTRQDLIELINVCGVFTMHTYLSVYLFDGLY